MVSWVETSSLGVNVLRVGAVAGLLLTLLGAGFVYIYASLVEGGYEAEVRAEPQEWAVAAAVLGAIAAAFAIYGFVACSRAAMRFGAVAQAIAAVIVLTVALPNFDFWRSDYERNADFEREFVALASLVLLFDVAVFFVSWALPRARKAPQRIAATALTLDVLRLTFVGVSGVLLAEHEWRVREGLVQSPQGQRMPRSRRIAARRPPKKLWGS